MDKYNFSPTSEISDLSNSESDMSSLSSFFNGGKNKKKRKISNSKKSNSNNIVSKNKSKFPPSMNRWLAWSLVSVSTIWILSSEYRDRGIFRSFVRWAQGKAGSQTSATYEKITEVLKKMIDDKLPLKDDRVPLNNKDVLQELYGGNVYAENYNHRVEVVSVDMDYKRFYYNVPFCKQVTNTETTTNAPVDITLERMLEHDLVKYYQKMCKLSIKFDAGLNEENNITVMNAIKNHLKFKFYTKMKQVKRQDELKNNNDSSPHLFESKDNAKYDLVNNFINMSPLRHKNQLFITNDAVPKKQPENLPHELIHPIKEMQSKAKVAAKAAADKRGTNIFDNDFNLHNNSNFEGAVFTESTDIDIDSNGTIDTNNTISLDILLSLLNNQEFQEGNFMYDKKDTKESLNDIETPLLSNLQSYAANCEGRLEKFHREYNKIGITKCLHFVLTVVPDFSDVVHNLMKNHKIHFVVPTNSEKLENNISIKIISSVYENEIDFKNNPYSSRVHNSISFHHHNTIGNFMENNANSRKAFIVPQVQNAKIAKEFSDFKAKHFENTVTAKNVPTETGIDVHEDPNTGGLAAEAKAAGLYLRSYYKNTQDTLWNDTLENNDNAPSTYTHDLTKAYRFLEDLVNTGKKGNLMVNDTIDNSATNQSNYKTDSLIDGADDLSKVFGNANVLNDHTAIFRNILTDLNLSQNTRFDIANRGDYTHIDAGGTYPIGVLDVPNVSHIDFKLRGNLLKSSYKEEATDEIQDDHATSNGYALTTANTLKYLSITGEEIRQMQANVITDNNSIIDHTALNSSVNEFTVNVINNAINTKTLRDTYNISIKNMYKYGSLSRNIQHNKNLALLLNLRDTTARSKASHCFIKMYEALFERYYYMLGNSVTFTDRHEHTLNPTDIFFTGNNAADFNDASNPESENLLNKNIIKEAYNNLKMNHTDIQGGKDLLRFIQVDDIHRFRCLSNDDYDEKIKNLETTNVKIESSKAEKIKEYQDLMESFLKTEVKYGEFGTSST